MKNNYFVLISKCFGQSDYQSEITDCEGDTDQTQCSSVVSTTSLLRFDSLDFFVSSDQKESENIVSSDPSDFDDVLAVANFQEACELW